MHFIDLAAQQNQQLPDGRTIRDAVDARIAEVLNHGRYILGPEVEELEHTLAAYVGVEHCIAVASGTDARHDLRTLPVCPRERDRAIEPSNECRSSCGQRSRERQPRSSRRRAAALLVSRTSLNTL